MKVIKKSFFSHVLKNIGFRMKGKLLKEPYPFCDAAIAKFPVK
jgi:hypothetical protein